jgi:hypothetical protein
LALADAQRGHGLRTRQPRGEVRHAGHGGYRLPCAIVATFLMVQKRSGPQWDASRPMEQQSGWPAHAAFMDSLVDAGVIVLGGPLADEHRVALVVEAASEDAARAAFAPDPWIPSHLRIDSIERWTIRLDGRRR